ncbi:MAG: type II toxin-antitoxin system prevent-host-death family antitoxin [Oscillospiraceae bacterium]|nr:type II toxin-antitoxin system prevent-host-death family antitoxin [Oscillospiraceae bacterium]
MYVTATEFKANFGKYAEIAQKQEIYVMKRGKEIFRTSPPAKKSRAELVEAMLGTLPKEAQRETRESIREGRLRERGCID